MTKTLQSRQRQLRRAGYSTTLGPRDPRWARVQASITRDTIQTEDLDIDAWGRLRLVPGRLEAVAEAVVNKALESLSLSDAGAAAKNVPSLTDGTTGTVSATGSLVDAGASYSQANANNNIATLNAKLDELRDALVLAGIMEQQ